MLLGVRKILKNVLPVIKRCLVTRRRQVLPATKNHRSESPYRPKPMRRAAHSKKRGEPDPTAPISEQKMEGVAQYYGGAGYTPSGQSRQGGPDIRTARASSRRGKPPQNRRSAKYAGETYGGLADVERKSPVGANGVHPEFSRKAKERPKPKDGHRNISPPKNAQRETTREPSRWAKTAAALCDSKRKRPPSAPRKTGVSPCDARKAATESTMRQTLTTVTIFGF